MLPGDGVAGTEINGGFLLAGAERRHMGYRGSIRGENQSHRFCLPECINDLSELIYGQIKKLPKIFRKVKTGRVYSVGGLEGLTGGEDRSIRSFVSSVPRRI